MSENRLFKIIENFQFSICFLFKIVCVTKKKLFEKNKANLDGIPKNYRSFLTAFGDVKMHKKSTTTHDIL